MTTAPPLSAGLMIMDFSLDRLMLAFHSSAVRLFTLGSKHFTQFYFIECGVSF